METQTVLQCDMVRICTSFKGTLFCNNDVSKSRMFNACLNFQIPALSNVGEVTETRTVLQSVTYVRTYGQGHNFMPVLTNV